MAQQNPHEKVHIDYPESLNYDDKKVYSPQPYLLDGYVQLPRQLAPPYQNKKS